MPEISFTTFVDFASKSGPARYTHVRNARRDYDGGYEVFKDFYRPLRDAIVELHRSGSSPDVLSNALSRLSDAKKRTNYPKAIDGHARWMRRMTPTWLACPTTRRWAAEGLSVRVNPELGLLIGGAPHLVKLHFKAEKLTKRQMDAILRMVEVTFADDPKGWTPSVLDVRRGKLITPTVDVPGIDAVLRSEAATFASLWRSLDDEAAA